MNIKTRSTKTFFILLAVLVLTVAINPFLPQGSIGTLIPGAQIPAWQMALAGAGTTAILYGLIGYLGLALWRKVGFPEIWAEDVTNRQRFLTPAIVGGMLGIVLIIGDIFLVISTTLGV